MRVSKLKTTGQLRDFLAETMTQVRAGKLGLDEAMRVAKLAGQINESFSSEALIARQARENGQALCKIGDLAIGAR